MSEISVYIKQYSRLMLFVRHFSCLCEKFHRHVSQCRRKGSVELKALRCAVGRSNEADINKALSQSVLPNQKMLPWRPIFLQRNVTCCASVGKHHGFWKIAK